MKNLLLAGTAACVLAFSAGAAQAALSLSGGTAGVIPPASATASNEALGPLGFTNPLAGFYAAQVNVTAGMYRFDYLGREAAATNTFRYGGGNGGASFTLSTASSSTNAFSLAGFSSFTRTLTSGGLLDFRFTTNVDGALGGGTVDNGDNPGVGPNNNRINFFATFASPAPGNPGGAATSGTVLYLFLDDTGPDRVRNQNPDDDNHDDMVIRITFIPEPASLALLGAGLLGLGAAVRRRRKA